MDMQNVSNLQISEGAVRTIHDKDGRLVWSRLNYDTKYAGDIFQQTYSGKNLMNYGVYDASDARVMNMPNLILSAGTYTISFDLDSFALGTNTSMGIYMSLYNAGGTNVTGDKNLLTINSSTPLERYSFTFTATDEVHGSSSQIRLANGVYSANGRCKLSNIQIEPGSTDTAYEPYTGGIPAPNPYYPQDVQVVTGEQTVTIGDGISSEDFVISLGSTEFCKLSSVSGAPSILSYQDYIYKSGSDWYIHKEIEKAVYDGSVDEEWGLHNTYNSIVGFRWVGAGAGHSNSAILSEKLLPIYITTYNSNNRTYGKIATLESSSTSVNSTVFITAPNSSVTTLAQFTSWLSNNNVTAYYASATPTDTQIADATLIGQLNAVHEWLTRYGYNATVSGNLPIIIDRTNL